MFRLPKELVRGIQKIRIARMAPEPRVLAMSIHTGQTCNEGENFKAGDSTGYVNKNGESVCNLVFPFFFLAYCWIQLLTQQRVIADRLQ